MFISATQAWEPDGTVMQPSGLLVLFRGRTELPHFCCKLLLQMLECYRKCNHARLACFLFKTSQHFVRSACIACLCFKVLHLNCFRQLCIYDLYIFLVPSNSENFNYKTKYFFPNRLAISNKYRKWPGRVESFPVC